MVFFGAFSIVGLKAIFRWQGPLWAICSSVFFSPATYRKSQKKKQQIRKKGQTKKFSAAPTAKEQRSILSRWSEVPGRRSIIIKKNDAPTRSFTLWPKKISRKILKVNFSHASSPQKILKENDNDQEIFWNRSSAVQSRGLTLNHSCQLSVLGGQLSSQEDFVLSQPLSVTD